MENEILKAIISSLKNIPIDFSNDDIIIMSEWGLGLYQDGWRNAKILLKNKND